MTHQPVLIERETDAAPQTGGIMSAKVQEPAPGPGETPLGRAIDQQIADAYYGFVTASDSITKGRYARSALAALWRGLSARDRGLFLGSLAGPEEGHKFHEWRKRWPKLDDPTLEAAYRCWNLVVRSIEGGEFGTEWDRKFAVEMQPRINGEKVGDKFYGNWTPKPKQQDQIKRLYRVWKSRQEARDGWLAAAE